MFDDVARATKPVVARATKPGRRPPRPKTYEAGRVCGQDGCDTELSRYNPQPFCWPHRLFEVPRIRGG